MTFCFIISTCLKNEVHYNQLIRCINSIKVFHEDSTVYLINDSDDKFSELLVNLNNIFSKLILINTLKKGSADQQVFNVICNITDNIFTHFIIIQDSMFLNNKLVDIKKVKNIKFLWHFTNHIIDWDNIKEPDTDYNIQNKIITHTDLIIHNLNKYYIDDDNFLKYSLDALIHKRKWCGCFGNCCIITKECLNFLNNKTNFVEKFINNNTNRERRMNESIFSLICHYYFPENNYEDSYDGLYYDGYNTNFFSDKPTGFDNLTYCCKNYYISKISFNR